MTFEIMVTEAASAQAEFGNPASNVLDGTETPVIIFADSSAILDIDTDVGCVRALHVIGITVASVYDFKMGTELPVYSVEEVRMNGQDGVATTRYYLRVMHAYATEWGTGDSNSYEAEGTIVIQAEVAGGNAYLTIATEANESNNSGAIYVYDKYWSRWNRCYISLKDEDIDVSS